MKVLHDFVGPVGAMSLNKGDVLELLRAEASNGWVLVRKEGEMGWVPEYDMREVQESGARIGMRGFASNTWDFAPSGKGRADMTEAEIRAARLARFQE